MKHWHHIFIYLNNNNSVVSQSVVSYDVLDFMRSDLVSTIVANPMLSQLSVVMEVNKSPSHYTPCRLRMLRKSGYSTATMKVIHPGIVMNHNVDVC